MNFLTPCRQPGESESQIQIHSEPKQIEARQRQQLPSDNLTHLRAASLFLFPPRAEPAFTRRRDTQLLSLIGPGATVHLVANASRLSRLSLLAFYRYRSPTYLDGFLHSLPAPPRPRPLSFIDEGISAPPRRDLGALPAVGSG